MIRVLGAWKKEKVRHLFNRKYGTTNLPIFEFVFVKMHNFQKSLYSYNIYQFTALATNVPDAQFPYLSHSRGDLKFKVTNMPENIKLDNPLRYGEDKLDKILAIADSLSFLLHLLEDAVGEADEGVDDTVGGNNGDSRRSDCDNLLHGENDVGGRNIGNPGRNNGDDPVGENGVQGRSIGDSGRDGGDDEAGDNGIQGRSIGDSGRDNSDDEARENDVDGRSNGDSGRNGGEAGENGIQGRSIGDSGRDGGDEAGDNGVQGIVLVIQERTMVMRPERMMLMEGVVWIGETVVSEMVQVV